MNKWLKGILIGLGTLVGILMLLVVGLVTFVLITWNRPVSRSGPELIAPIDTKTLARGDFLYNYSMQCWHCHGSEGSHSSGESQAGGREFDVSEVGPGFGYYYASNLTPDFETGIGNWSDSELVRAIREGLDKDGQLIMPIHPFEFNHGLSDEDALALAAYMRSLSPIYNKVPDSLPSFAAKALMALGIIKPAPPISDLVPSLPRGVNVAYGKYLAWHASGCAECHTPRDPNTVQIDHTRPFAGGLVSFPEEGFTTTGSNLTPCKTTGIGDWSEQDFLTAMHTGMRPDGTIMLPFHPWPYFDKWSDEDLRAVWLYLSSLEAVTHAVPTTTLTGAAANAMGASRGEALFDIYCVMCHGEDGSGGPLTSIILEDVAHNMEEGSLAKLIADGFSSSSKHSFGKTFNDEQITDLVTFIMSW